MKLIHPSAPESSDPGHSVNIADRIPLADVEAAHERSQSGRMIGKLVLRPR